MDDTSAELGHLADIKEYRNALDNWKRDFENEIRQFKHNCEENIKLFQSIPNPKAEAWVEICKEILGE